MFECNDDPCTQPHLADSSMLAQLDDQEAWCSRLTRSSQTAASEQSLLRIFQPLNHNLI